MKRSAKAAWASSIAPPIGSIVSKSDRHFARAKSVMQGRIRSVLCVPLREKGEAIGVIYLEDKRKRGKFSQQDIMSLLTLSQQVGERLGLKISD